MAASGLGSGGSVKFSGASPTALGLLPVGEDPAAFTLPPEPKPLAATVPCGETEVLQLYPAHLRLIATAPPATDPCEP